MSKGRIIPFWSARPPTLHLCWRDHGLVVLLMLLMSGPMVYAADLDALLIDAVRYANTPEKHAAKVAAREELRQHMPEAISAAMEYAHGDNVMLQVLVMEWVTQLPTKTIVPALLDFVDHDRKDTRRLAIFFLGFHDTPEYAGRIMPYLDDDRCRGSAIRTLGKWKVVSARAGIENWLADGKERIRVVAANALRDIGDPAAIPALIKALDDPVFTVRNTAARAIVSFGEAAEESLNKEGGEMHQRCLADLHLISQSEVLPKTVIVDGQFFLP